MKTLKLIIAFAFFSTLSFGQTNDSLPNYTSFNLIKNISFISFGTFCFSCRTEKVVLFYYDNSSIDKGLYLDKTEKYFATKDKSSFSTIIKDSTKIKLALSIIQNIPKRLFQTDKLEQKFGCPDCFDQGGIYVEIGQYQQVKRFYIDCPRADEFGSDIKNFVTFFNKAFREITK